MRVIVFEQNRGYGAAIKEGFARSSGELVAFLDADGTCDPTVFADLCSTVQQEDAAVALGSRMGPDTQMPRVRRLGNNLYALLLGSTQWPGGERHSEWHASYSSRRARAAVSLAGWLALHTSNECAGRHEPSSYR